MKPVIVGWIACLGLVAAASAATIEITGGGADTEALLRIPVPAGHLDAEPGQAVLLVDEKGREVPAQVELAGLDKGEIEIVLVRPAGMGKVLRVGKTQASPPERACTIKGEKGDKGYTVTLASPAGPIACYYVDLRKHVAHPEYNVANFFHPLVTPAGVTVTDDAPEDHLHHRGLFMAFTSVKWSSGGKELAGNFWHKPDKAKIAPGKLSYARGGAVCSTLGVSHDFKIGDQVVLAQDVIARAARLNDRVNVLDVEYRITPKDGDVEFGENYYSCLQLRGAGDFKRPDLVFTYADGKPHRDVDKRKENPPELPPFDRWLDETGLIKDKPVGAAVAIHPDVPKSRLCYSRGVKGLNLDFVFDKPLKLAAGKTLRCRYQVYIHDGTAAEAQLGKLADWFNPGAEAKWAK